MFFFSVNSVLYIIDSLTYWEYVIFSWLAEAMHYITGFHTNVDQIYHDIYTLEPRLVVGFAAGFI